MIRGIFIALLLLNLRSNSAIAQVNLVLNGDFEQHTFCPNDYNQIKACAYWSGIDSTGLGNCDVMDYCHTCSNGSNVGIPYGEAYYQHPHSGNAFAEVEFYFNDSSDTFFRHYLQGRLNKTLSAGRKYCVSFWVCLAEGSKYAIEELSAYLDNGIIDTATICGMPQTTHNPQITNKKGIIIDTMNWTKIEGSFIANGDERFITIGNFKDNGHTTKVALPANKYNSLYPYNAIYLVDDVSVIECTGVGVESINGLPQNYTVAPNPNDGIVRLTQALEDNTSVAVSVCNTLGTVVHKTAANFKNSIATLDLSSIASGMYYLIMHDSAGTAYTLRFVKK